MPFKQLGTAVELIYAGNLVAIENGKVRLARQEDGPLIDGSGEHQEVAQTIVSMLRAALMAMTNDREGHPLHSYQQNRMGPGMHYAMGLIQRAYNLPKSDQK